MSSHGSVLVESQAQMDELLSGKDWNHGFLKSMVSVSPETLQAIGAVIAPSSLGNLRILMLLPENVIPGVFMEAEGVHAFAIHPCLEHSPRGMTERDRAFVELSPGAVIACRRLRIGWLDRATLELAQRRAMRGAEP